MRAGGKRRLDPETLGVVGRRRELQGVGTATARLPSAPRAPPCAPCICGSERGVGHCLPELAEFPVLFGVGGGAAELRACQEGNSHGPECRLSYGFSFPTSWRGGVGDGGKQMECGSCSLPYWGTELPRPTRGEKAPRMGLMQRAAERGQGRATGPDSEATSRSRWHTQGRGWL